MQLKSLKDLYADKKGISVTDPIDFGKLQLGSTKTFFIWIRYDMCLVFSTVFIDLPDYFKLTLHVFHITGVNIDVIFFLLIIVS